jgi:sec-independent protein translocase protein TatC
MADETELLPPDPNADPEDEGGGPIKTFVEHLEDLRWTIIKAVLSVVVGVIMCLSAAPKILEVLLWPLQRSQSIRLTEEPRVSVKLGTNVVARGTLKQFGALPGLSTNSDSVVQFQPLQVGTNWVWAAVVQTNAEALPQNPVDIKAYGPGKVFTIFMQVAIYGGLVVSAPFVFFFLGQFILPALHVHERKFLFKVTGIGSALFLLGVAFCYFLILVICLSTTVAFANYLGLSSDEWQADEYISFVCWFMLGMGLAFELPLVLLTLVKIGILDSAKLAKFRMYWVVGGLVLSAFITPDGSPVTMVLLFAPLHLLYEISVLIAKYWERQARKRQRVVELEGDGG